MQGVPYHLNCLACSLDYLVEICRCKRAAQDGSETLMHPQQKRQNSIKSNLNWSRKLDLCNLQIFCATWLIVHIRVKDNCHVVNFELSCCKFCIYTHPVNSKFTTWHNDDVGFEDSNNDTQWRIQKFKNRGARSRCGIVFEVWRFCLIPLHTYPMLL